MTLVPINTNNNVEIENYRNKAYQYVDQIIDADKSHFNDLKDEYLTEDKLSKNADIDDVFGYYCISILSNTFFYIKEKIDEFNKKMDGLNKTYTKESRPETIRDESGTEYSVTNPIEVQDEIIETTIKKIKPIGKEYICLLLGGPIGDYAIEKTNKFIEDATKSTSGGKRNHQKRKPTKKKRKFTKKRSSHQ